MILTEIVTDTKKRVARGKAEIGMEQIIREAEQKTIAANFEKTLREHSFSYICEVKKASPSKGIIAHDFNPVKLACEYEAAGATALSVLTEPTFFKGDIAYLREISEHVKIPILRKDFIIDPYQIYEAKAIGASAILLICAILTRDELRSYHELATKIGLSVLVEAHTSDEVAMAIEIGATIIGVNNRDLKTFEVDINNSIRLRADVPREIIFVAESGITTRDDIIMLSNNKIDAVLIGEYLMKSHDKKAALDQLKGV